MGADERSVLGGERNDLSGGGQRDDDGAGTARLVDAALGESLGKVKRGGSGEAP